MRWAGTRDTVLAQCSTTTITTSTTAMHTGVTTPNGMHRDEQVAFRNQLAHATERREPLTEVPLALCKAAQQG